MSIFINEYTRVIPNMTKDLSVALDYVYKQWNGVQEIKNVYQKGEMRKTNFKPSSGYEFKQFIANDVNLEVLQYCQPSKNVVLMVHGGSFVYRMSDNFAKMIPFYAEASSHATVVTVDYRVAPHVTYQEMIRDVVRGYEWVLGEGYKPENIVIAGDSSGGGTTLATVLYLREHNYPMPAGVITLSACTNMGCNTVSFSEKFQVDCVFGRSGQLSQRFATYVGEDDFNNPYISPYFANYHGFPPMLIQVGSNEMLLDDSKDIAKKAHKQGVDVTLEIYENMFHDFQMCKGVLVEADMAWIGIERFLERVLKK